MAPARTDEANPDLDPQLLYEKIPQNLDEPPAYRLRLVLVTPEIAAEWLRRSEEEPNFRNRDTKSNHIRRHRVLMDTDRFIHYLPDGPILKDPSGVLLNGKHRLSAIVQHGKPVGLVVIEGVPRWMMRFFDTGKNKNLKDLLTITGRFARGQVQSSARLAMRYEEMIFGKRPEFGWRYWGQYKGDELTDIDTFLATHEGLSDFYASAQKVYGRIWMLQPALMTFRFYQELAWPQGLDQINAFWDGLYVGENMRRDAPALALREWSRSIGRESMVSKRETHLFLLNTFFRHHVNDRKMDRVQFGFGMAMPVPFHPEGDDAARASIERELAIYRNDYLKEQQQAMHASAAPSAMAQDGAGVAVLSAG